MIASIWQWVTEPLLLPFMQNALLTALSISVICAVMSCFLILKGWSLLGDAISHAILPGIVLAFVVGIPLVLGALIAGLFCVTSIGYLNKNTRIKEDTIIGIVFSGLFALGLVLFSKIETDQHLMHILFGDLLGVNTQQLIEIAVISLIVLLLILLKLRDFLLYCFDSVHAKTMGLPITFLHYSLLTLLALTIISAMQIVGIILVIPMLIAPGIIGFILTKQFTKMVVIAICSATLSTFLGILVSYHLDSATSPTIVLIQALFFTLALSWSKWYQNKQLLLEQTNSEADKKNSTNMGFKV